MIPCVCSVRFHESEKMMHLSEFVSAQALPLEADFSVLNPLFEGKRFVLLGEPDHWIHEKYAYRLRLIDHLLGLGWRHLGMEMGHSDGQRLQHYLQQGQPEWLDRLALYGAQVPAQGIQTPAGLLGAPAEGPGQAGNAFVAEEKRFAQTLFAWQQSRKLSLGYFGFDIDTRPGGGYQDMLQLLAEFTEVRGVVALQERLMGIQALPVTDALSALDALLPALPALPAEASRRLRADIQCLRDSLHFVDLAFVHPSFEQLMEAYAEREKTMFRQFEAYLSTLPADARLILMGHNMHLLKRASAFAFGAPPETVPLWPTIGEFICRHYPEQTLVVWMLFQQGEHSAPIAGLPPHIAGRPDSVESQLAALGDGFVLPVDERVAEFGQPGVFSCNNGQPVFGTLSQAADLIWFQAKVSGLRA